METYIRIQCAVEFMEHNLQEELSITDIASKAVLSPFHFQRLFQAISAFPCTNILESGGIAAFNNKQQTLSQ
jgi:transcriptional regulator GlxA family with amidase domain